MRKILRCRKSSNQKRNTNEKEEVQAELEQVKKNICLERFRHHYNIVKSKKKDCKDLDSCITCFQKKLKDLDYMCAVCNGIIYRKTVTELQQSKHNIHNFFTRKKSFDDKEYFRKTCNSKLSKGCIPRQAVCRTRMSGKT